MRAAVLLAGVLLLGALAPIAARADSIVYLKSGNVWIAHGDGSGARQFTLRPYGWASPSEADDGTVVAAGGLARVNADGSDSDGSSELYRFSGDGNQLGGAIPTYGSRSTPACPTYGPDSVRVSPDASRIAYGIWTCGDPGYTALWTPASATGLSFPNQTLGQKDFYEPAWVDSSRFVVSHVGPTLTDTSARWFVHPVAGADYADEGAWNEPSMTGTGAQGVISRAGDKLAVFEDDAADYLDGKPRNVSLWLYTSPDVGLPAAGHGWTKRCEVSLDAASTQNPHRLSPSFSPDGTKLVWGDDKGIEVASVSDLSNCATITPALLIAGGAQPFYSPANPKAAAASPRQPGGGTSAPSGGTSATSTPSGAAGTTTVLCKVPKLKGRTLRAAKRLLERAHCKLGRVKRPRASRRKLVVKSQSPRAGTTHKAATKVRVTLAPKRKRG